jgi:chorismate dehydratase
MSEPLTIGIVPYLNAWPLVRGLGREFPGSQVVSLTPADLAARLLGGEIDVAMVSSIFAGENDGFVRLGDACIASRAEVRSVQLFHGAPVDRIRRVGLDTSSRSSIILGRIILERHFGLSPEYAPFPPGDDFTASGLDAAVVIGDRTFDMLGRKVDAVDLGAAWRDYTGLPFVYAFWTGSSARDWGRTGRRLENVRNRNLEEMESTVREASERWNRPLSFCRDYLTRNVHFRFGPGEAAGLKRFYREAAELQQS